jgi:tetratricopeptide (TPR) repeat protein
MNTASATRISDRDRPLFFRAFRKWYCWAGLALATTASYLAFDGQLKLDGISLLKAAPSTTEASATPELLPDPTELKSGEGPPLPNLLELPDVVPIPPKHVKPLQGSPAEAALDAYMKGLGIVPAGNQEVSNNNSGAMAPVPAPPVVQPPTAPSADAPPLPPVVVAPAAPQPQAEPFAAQVVAPPDVQPAPNLAPAPFVAPEMPAVHAASMPAAATPAPVIAPTLPVVAADPMTPVLPVAAPAPVLAEPMTAPAPTAAPAQVVAPAAPVAAVEPMPLVLPVAAPAQAPPAAPPVSAPAAPVAQPLALPDTQALPPNAGNAPAPNAPRVPETPGVNFAEKAPERPQPILTLPNQQAQAGEQIPVRPTPILSPDFALNAELAREAESLKDHERVIYLSAQNNARLKDWARMSEDFEHLFKLRPDLIYIRAEYAGLLVTAAELQKAVEQYRRVIDMKPDATQYRIRLGDLYVIAKDYKAAIRIYTDALKSPPFEPEYAVRLARAYAFDNDFEHSFQVYDHMLASIRVDDPKAPAALGALLLDLDVPMQAMPYLLEKRKQLEKNVRGREIMLLEVMGSIIRGYARLGERQLAMEVIAELPTVAINQVTIRETLAAQLMDIEEYELAAQIYNQVLQLEPTNGVAIIGMARVYLEMYRPAQARQILDSFRPAPRQVRDYLSTYAVYHQRVGESIEAKQIYSDMLRRNENDHEVRLAFGLLFYRARGKDEWEQGKAEFAKIPPQDRFGRQARRYFADTLSRQRKFQEALEIDRLLLTEDPTDYLTVAMATKHYAKAGMYEQGIALARGFLATNPRSEGQAVAVRMALARALLEARKYLDAVREYEILISRPIGRKVEAYYGIARAHEKLGNAERAKQFLACTAGLPGGEFRNRLTLAELYAADYDDQTVVGICSSLLAQDPQHLPTLICLADSQQRQSRFSGRPADAFRTAQTILSLSNTNARGHIVMARSFSVAQNFRKSAAQYDQIIQYDPELYTGRKERARVLYADHQYSAARTAWNQLLHPSADEQLIININDVITRNPKMQAFLQPYIISGVAGPGLRKELGRLAVTVPDADLRLGVHRLCCDYDACLAAQNAVRIEAQAMELKDYRSLTALNALPTSPEFEPTNTDTIYAMGQQLGALNRNTAEIEWYNKVLAIDPTNRDAQVAAERSNADMGPKLDGIVNYFHQIGRDGLATIDRTDLTADGRIPLGDENEYFEVGYTRAFYHSPTGEYPNTYGNIPFFRVQKRFCDDLLLTYAQVNLEEYNNGFRTRPTFDIGEIYQFCDWVWLKAGGYLENVAENGESIRQDIYRGGFYTGADLRPTRIWSFGGQYQYAHYSDNNDMNAFQLYNAVELTQAPKLLRLAEYFYYWGYREGTVFPTNPPNPLDIFGAIHPYFSPAGYSQAEIRLEWWHWLSRDYNIHTNQCYYSLQFGLMTDSSLVTFYNLRALLNYDVCTWLTIGASAQAQLSSVYNEFSAMGYFQIRFK